VADAAITLDLHLARLPGKGYDEGATVQALERNGAWTRIRGSDGREGWVLSVTLAQ
jgi:hypothetical protein